MGKSKSIGRIIKSNATNIILVILLTTFLFSSLFIALRTKTTSLGIIPDENAHFIFSKHFSTTLGIPEDTEETYIWGWYIQQNPFLYYWINARIINLLNFVFPKITNYQILISLRLINVFYAMLTLIFLFLFSRELIQNEWWQLLPVFLLTNTLMFVFLSGGINYDNLANMFSMAAFFFLIRVFKHKHFLHNSFAWFISIALGTLVKYTIVPLALAMAISLALFIIYQRKIIFPIKFKGVKTILLSLLSLLLLIGNFSIYGINLIQYQSLRPPCREILSDSQCELSGYEQRYDEIALDSKLTITESVEKGYPSIVRYVFVDWVYHMLMRSFGMISPEAYFPHDTIILYRVLFYWMVLLGAFNLLYWQKISNISIHLIWITIFYTIILFINNYNSELIYGFKQISLQGRYIFPIIGAIYLLYTKILVKTPFRILQWATVAFTLGLFLYGGPVTILRGFNTFLQGWFY